MPLSLDLLIALGQNIALLIVLAFFYGFVRLRLEQRPRLRDPIMGLLFGAVALVGMVFPVEVAPGVIFGGQVVVVALAGAFGGGVVGGTAALLASGYRFLLGGAGTVPGIGALLGGAAIGVLLRRRWQAEDQRYRPLQLLLLGALVALQSLSWTLVLPAELRWSVMIDFLLPVLLGYPLGTVLLGTVFGLELRRQAALDALRRSEARFRSLTENALDLITIVDEDGVVRYISPSVEEVLGVRPAGMVGRPLHDRFHPEERGALAEAFAMVQRQPGLTLTRTYRMRHADGTWRVHEGKGRLVPGIGTVINSRDITARRRAERVQSVLFHIAEATSTSESLETLLSTIHRELGKLIDTTNFYIALYDAEQSRYRFPYIVDRYEETVVVSQPELRRSLTDYVRRTGQPMLIDEEKHERLIAAGEVELVGRPSVQWMGVPLDTARDVIGVVAVQSYDRPGLYSVRDLELLSFVSDHVALAIQRQQAETRLAEQRQQLHALVEHLPEGVALLDADGRIELANPTAREYLPLLGVQPDDDRPLTALAGRPLDDLVRFDRLSWTDVELAGPPRRVFAVTVQPIERHRLLVVREVTRARELQARVRQQDRLAAVGQLAGGVAHDFNNILQAIIGFTELVRRRDDLPSDVERPLARIAEQGGRAAELVRQLLDFSRRSDHERELVDLRRFAQEVSALLERTLPASVQLRLELTDALCVVYVDVLQLEQAVLNVALNARDAMPDGGTLTLRLGRLTVPARDPETATDDTVHGLRLEAGEWAQLELVDTGTGMPDDIQARVLEPFFTTKPVGQGTGLGLSQVYGIMQQHDGHIALQSTVGEGTTVALLLPLADEAALPSAAARASDLPRGRGEVVLVVEDDDVVRSLAEEMLLALGYEVCLAAEGAAGLAVFEQRADEIDLVLLDVVMPGRGGLDVLRALRDRAQSVPVVLMSGHVLDERAAALQSAGDVGFLAKPFVMETLASVVHEAIEGPSDGPPPSA